MLDAATPSVAIAGTSGKSTIVGMIGWILRENGVRATVLGGADFVGEGAGGCFVAGPADGPAVAEACESDGTLVGYSPVIGIIHNVTAIRDELNALRPQFMAFARNCGQLLVGMTARRPRRWDADSRGDLRAGGRRRRQAPGDERQTRRARACCATRAAT